MRKSIKVILIVIGIPLIYLFVIILLGTLSNFKPDSIEIVETGKYSTSLDDSVFTAMIWNIGYAGLGDNMDFFYDGGSKVRDSKNNTILNLDFIKDFICANDSIDFVLLQEVDQKSKRSYRINQVEQLNKILKAHNSYLAMNYNVLFVPLPLYNPMGSVKSGLLSYSKFQPVRTERHAFPGNYSWPMGVFMLDRCFMTLRFSLKTNNELIIINTHNSAYDDGSLRNQQMNYLKQYLLEEEKKGNHIIVGGDWNQCPPQYSGNLSEHVFDTVDLTYVENNYPGGNWTFSYDSLQPTNRRIMSSYAKGKTPVSLIDYFLCSPGIEVLNIFTVDLEFKYADHNPVIIKFKIK